MVEQEIALMAIDFIKKQYGANNYTFIFFKGKDMVDNPEFKNFSIHESDYYIIIQDSTNQKRLINITGDQFDGIVLKMILNMGDKENELER